MGYNQDEGLNYEDMFSPIVRPATIHAGLSIVVLPLDVHNAFLHGYLQEEVLVINPWVRWFFPSFPCMQAIEDTL